MNKLSLIIIGFSLAACVSRQDVHIFTEGYSSDEIDRVVQLVDELGFNARLNSLEIPEDIRRTSIIYPAIVQDFASIDKVRHSLSEAGFPNVELIHETLGEHYYSTQNIGLYLVNPIDVRPEGASVDEGSHSDPQLSRIYYSNCDNLEAQLNLFPQGVAVLEIYEWSDRTNRELSRLIDGEWKNFDRTVVFELFNGGVIQFTYSEFSGSDDYGRYYGIELENEENSTQIGSCDFRFVTYDA